MSGAALVWAANVRGLRPSTKIVLIQLAERCNKDTMRCDPSLEKLADDCEMHRASVLRHLADLEAAGLITREAQGRENGGRASTQYHLHMEQRSQIATGAKVANEGGKGRNLSRQRSHGCDPHIEPVLNLNEPSHAKDHQQPSLLSEDEAPKVDLTLQAFDEFWAAYPKKVGKKEALTAFKRAINSGANSQEIISGAEDFANSVIGKDRQYIKNPQGWLTDERWKSEADPEIERQREYYRRIREQALEDERNAGEVRRAYR